MASNDNFSLYFSYCGNFITKNSRMEYTGGDFKSISGLDKDRFGFLDLEAEVQNLGLVTWSKLRYRIPKTDIYKVIIDDKETMEMLTWISKRNKIINVFVEGGVSMNDVTDDGLTGEGNEMECADILDEEVNLGWDNEIEEDKADKSDAYIDSYESSAEDLEYAPSESELDDVSLGELDYISDEECERKNLNEMSNLFDVINSKDGFEDIDQGHEHLSDYEKSDDDDLPSFESENENLGKIFRKNKIVYDPKCNHAKLQIVLGMQFEDGIQCREALTTWGIENGKFFRFRCVTKTKLVAMCKPPCPWMVYGSVVQGSGTFVIKSYGGDHSCPRAMTNKLISSKWIAKRYLNVFRIRYNLSAKDLKADILQRFKSYVSKDRLYKARQLAQELVRGSVDAHYASIQSYIAELRRVDREGRYELLLGVGAVFKGFYMGLSALKKGFKASCRPLIGLDGCFLKTYLGGILLCATGKDGNNGMIPIAWAIVEIENEDCWTWFLKCLLEDLEIANGNGWTFISDQQKGLQNAVANLDPQTEHRNYARHVSMNWKKQHKGVTFDYYQYYCGSLDPRGNRE